MAPPWSIMALPWAFIPVPWLLRGIAVAPPPAMALPWRCCHGGAMKGHGRAIAMTWQLPWHAPRAAPRHHHGAPQECTIMSSPWLYCATTLCSSNPMHCNGIGHHDHYGSARLMAASRKLHALQNVRGMLWQSVS